MTYDDGAGAWPLVGLGPREGLPAGLVWPARRGAEGGPTDWHTRTGAYRQVARGLWVPAGVEQTVDQRIVEAAALVPAYGAITGWAALRWCGGAWFEGTGSRQAVVPVPIALGDRHTIRPRQQVETSEEILPPGTIRRHRGLRVTTPLWSVAYAMRKAPTDEAAVVAFELAALHDLVSVAELASYAHSTLWVRQGVPRVRRVLPLLEENSWSPMEPLMRLAWMGSGKPRPLCNHPVFTRDGRFVGTPDLIDPVAGVYGMYDGALHLAGAVRGRDVAKEAAYRALGLEGATMMAGDISDQRAFLRRLDEAYGRAANRSVDDRRWRTDLPPWWVPTVTVAQRRALTASQRDRFLRYRPAA